jgi:hypothetical protein
MDGYAKLEKMLHKGEITVDEVLHIALDNKLMNARSVKEVETSVDKRIASLLKDVGNYSFQFKKEYR